MKRIAISLALLAGLATAAHAAVPICVGSGCTTVQGNANGALYTQQGVSTRSTYIATVGTQATTAAVLLSLEAPSNQYMKIYKICFANSDATAAAAVTVTVRRTTTASSGGTALTAEGTGVTAVTKLDPNDANFTGVARVGGTPGTAGATIDQFGLVAGTLAGNVIGPLCQTYGDWSMKPIIVTQGTANGVSVNVSAAGSGGLSNGSISIYFTSDTAATP